MVRITAGSQRSLVNCESQGPTHPPIREAQKQDTIRDLFLLPSGRLRLDSPLNPLQLHLSLYHDLTVNRTRLSVYF